MKSGHTLLVEHINTTMRNFTTGASCQTSLANHIKFITHRGPKTHTCENNLRCHIEMVMNPMMVSKPDLNETDPEE